MNTTHLIGAARLSLAAGLVLTLVSCGAGGGSSISVSAASSLTDVFGDIESAFETAHPDIDVVLNLAGSSTLREQIVAGAPADVFASADRSDMDRLRDAGELAGEARVFARNRLQIAVPSGNPGAVTGLVDFARPELLIGLCLADVPCGSLARDVLMRSGVVAEVDTNEPDVRALLTKIETGELDAGITYVTDVIAASGSIVGIEIPGEVNIEVRYPIAVLANASNRTDATTFIEFVLSTEGQALLAAHGFGAP